MIEDDVISELSYAATGIIDATFPSSLSEEEIIDLVVENIANVLGTHANNVVVEINPTTGEIEYTVLADTLVEAEAFMFDLENEIKQNAIRDGILAEAPDAVLEFQPDSDISLLIDFTVDADNATNDMTQAEFLTRSLLSDFDVTSDSNRVNFFQ